MHGTDLYTKSQSLGSKANLNGVLIVRLMETVLAVAF